MIRAIALTYLSLSALHLLAACLLNRRAKRLKVPPLDEAMLIELPLFWWLIWLMFFIDISPIGPQFRRWIGVSPNA